MRIAFVGPFTFERWTLFVSTYFTALSKTCKNLGHEVRIFSYHEMLQHPWFYDRFGDDYLYIRKRFRKIFDLPYEFLLMREILNKIKDYSPDAVLIHPMDCTYFHLLVRKLRQSGFKTLAWLGVNPEYLPAQALKPFTQVDCLLYYDRAYEETFKRLQCKGFERLPFGVDVDHYDSIILDKERELEQSSQVAFIGAINEERIEVLKALTPFPLGIWTYNKKEIQAANLERYYHDAIFGDEMIRVMKSSAIVINIHRRLEISGGNYRLFEIPAARICQIVDYKPGIGEYFEIDKEIVTFKSTEELKSKVAELLRNSSLRNEIALAGYNRVKKEHTLDKRVGRLIEIIGGLD